MFIYQHVFAVDQCHQLAVTAHNEFYVCTQYDQLDRCFNDFVLKYKPANQCHEWQSVCINSSQIAEISSEVCFE